MEKSRKFIVKGDLKDVQLNFEDFYTFGELHPLFVEVEKLFTEPLTFRILEKPFSWLPLKIKYKAEIEAINNSVIYKAKGLPFKTVILHFVFNEKGNSTTIDLTIKIDSYLPGKIILINKMMDAQCQVVKNIEKKL